MDEQAVHTQPAEAVSASQSIVAQQGQLGDKAAGGEQARSTPGAADGGAVQPTEADAQIDTEGPAPASQAASPASHGAPPTQGAASASASPRLPLPPRLDFEPLPVRPPAQHSAEDDGQESPTGGGGGGSPRRRSSIVVAFAKGVGNRLGLRNKGAPGEADGAQAHVDGEDAAAPSAPSADQGGDDSPRRRRPSVTARAAVSEDASGPGQPSTAPSGDAQGDALHIEGASFVSDAQGGDFQSSPKAGAQRAPPHSAPRQGSLQDLTAHSAHPGIQRSNTMPHPGRRRSILKKPTSPASATRGRRISFADDSARPLEDVKYCDNLHYSEGSQHAGEEDEKCVIM